MGVARSCDHDCRRPAVWYVDYEHDELDRLRSKMKHCNADDILEIMMESSRRAEELSQKIRPVVGKVQIIQSVNLRMHSLLCDRCFNKIELENLPKDWGYTAIFKQNGYHRK